MSTQRKPRQRANNKGGSKKPTVIVVAPPQPKNNAKKKRAAKRKRAANMALPVTISGRGGYFADNGASLGQWIGGAGGRAAGSMLDTVFGLGAYNVKQNSMVSMDNVRFAPGGPPRVRNGKQGEATIFTHREYIGELITGAFNDNDLTPFKIQEFNINPGNSALFPWLSQAAEGFQEYEVQGMLVELITEASTFAQNLALGTVMMAAEYNPVAYPPGNKIALLEMEYSSSCKTSESLIMPIECARKNDSETHLFIARDNDYMEAKDARNFNLGKIFIATQGAPAENAKVAEMWCTYQVALFKPKLPTISNVVSGSHVQMTNCTEAQPFGDSGSIVYANGSNPNIVVQTNLVDNTGIITFPIGEASWKVDINWRRPGATTAGGLAVVNLIGGKSHLELIYALLVHDDSTFGYASEASGVVAGTTFSFVVTVEDTVDPVKAAVLKTGGFGSLASAYGDIYITRWPGAITT